MRPLPALFLEGIALGTMCRYCGRFVGRKKGRLSEPSWETAVYAHIEQHEQRCERDPGARGRK